MACRVSLRTSMWWRFRLRFAKSIVKPSPSLMRDVPAIGARLPKATLHLSYLQPK